MNSEKSILDLLLSDYKSIKKEKSNLFIIKYAGIITVIITQLLTTCFENYFLTPMLLLIFISLYLKESKLNSQQRMISETLSQYTGEYNIGLFQENRYFQNRIFKKTRIYEMIEFCLWTILSVSILYFKIKYVC
jgi:hypothetical protein